jgi:predicted nucleic acid-binding Zn ribbon protein
MRADEVVSKLMQSKGWSRGGEHREVFEAWAQVVPESIGRRTRAVSFRGGRLIVIVESAPLMQELQLFRQAEFLSLLNSQLVNRGQQVIVRRLEFRRS